MAEQIDDRTADLRPVVVHTKLRFILDAINATISSRKFFVLSEDEAVFHGNSKLFGDSFPEKYSIHALREALCAGGCYAASQYTACVFHCMRVAEYGLRKLAANRTLRIKLTKKGHPCPIEYATWQDVITAIQNKIKKIRQRPIGVKREAELQFLSSAADHCDYMKEIWRNEMAHTRRWYKKEEALSVINRVKEFVTAVGEHRGSSPDDDTFPRIFAEAQAMEAQHRAASELPAPTPPSAV